MKKYTAVFVLLIVTGAITTLLGQSDFWHGLGLIIVLTGAVLAGVALSSKQDSK